MNTEKNIYDYSVKNTSGELVGMSQYKEKVVLIVNVASKCGFTPQYQGLEALYKEFKDSGLVILGFPCNQFGAQEPGNESEIQQFCSLTYDVSFPIMSKINVNGSDSAPIYDFLKSSAPGFLGTKIIKWNFTKFLVGKDGQVIKRYAPNTEPADIAADIKKALA
ncbi:MAG: glutathione peroxidase [Bdellovibrionaceae bacterium]|nr:glutathione peroxidase [Pseudobdellovibrionaceae bacterium]